MCVVRSSGRTCTAHHVAPGRPALAGPAAPPLERVVVELVERDRRRHRRRDRRCTASGAVSRRRLHRVPSARPRPPRRRRRCPSVGCRRRRSAARVGCRRSSASLTTARRRRSPRRARLRRGRPPPWRRRRRRRSSARGRRRRRCSPPPPRRGPWPRRPSGAAAVSGLRRLRPPRDPRRRRRPGAVRPRCRGRHRSFASSVQMCCRLLRPAQCSCRVRRRPVGPPWVVSSDIESFSHDARASGTRVRASASSGSSRAPPRSIHCCVRSTRARRRDRRRQR